jgi:hypothetical protein
MHNTRNKTQLNYHGVANDHSLPNCQLLTTGIDVVGKVVFPGKPTRVSGKQENAGEVLDNGGPGREPTSQNLVWKYLKYDAPTTTLVL